MTSLDELCRIAEVEFAHIVVGTQALEAKRQLFIRDSDHGPGAGRRTSQLPLLLPLAMKAVENPAKLLGARVQTIRLITGWSEVRVLLGPP